MLRPLAVVALALVALWLSTAVTLAMVVAPRSPDLVLRWWPASAGARAAKAAQILQSRPSPARLEEARELAIAALRREPGNVVAARTLGLTGALRGDQALALRMFTYSESLSRRDVPTQLWLIEDRVQHDDIAGALRHYDRALRTSEGVRDLLFPVLAQATANPGIATQVADLVATRPLWWPAFIDQLLTQSDSPQTVALIIRRMRLDPDEEADRQRLVRAMDRLVRLGAYRPAYALYQHASGGAAGRSLVQDGSFETVGRLGIFEWTLVDEPGLGGVREAREGGAGSVALSVISTGGRNGEVARQMILLPPGRYQLAASAGAVPQEITGRPVLTVLCPGPPQLGLAQIQFPPAEPTGSRSGQRFVVPAGCPAQWMVISTGSGPDEAGPMPWIDAIEIRRE